MKKILVLTALSSAVVSVLTFGVSLCYNTMESGNFIVWSMLIALALGAFISLADFATLMSKKIIKTDDKNGTNTQRVWPLWVFLASFVLIALLYTACLYLAINKWCLRDLLNFELVSVLSIIIVRWFNYRLFKK